MGAGVRGSGRERRVMAQDSFAGAGVPGFDRVLGGGWPRRNMYLVLGHPGTGKTTLALQFLLDGLRAGERTLYVTLSETSAEVRGAAASHGWNLDGVELFDLAAAQHVLGLEAEATMFDPTDVEFRETTRAIREALDRVQPQRVVFDSLSELALLARDTLAFRREILMLKQKLADLGATTLLLSDRTTPEFDRQLQSLAHGVLTLEELVPEFGAERRRLRITKLRATAYRGGYHDFRIETGGLVVFPRLVASEHSQSYDATPLSTRIEGLDSLLGGGLDPGSTTLLVGPAGCGKSTLMMHFADAAVRARGPATIFLFDEQVDSLLRRARAFQLPVANEVGKSLHVHLVHPGELSPGEFAHRVCHAVEVEGSRFLAIDSLNGYLHAMTEERHVALQLHELLAYLDAKGVIAMLVLAQQGLFAGSTAPIDVSYVADTVILARYFEHAGRLRRALSVTKKRAGPHENWIREYSIGADGIAVGSPLRSFHGLFSGTPTFTGERDDLLGDGKDA